MTIEEIELACGSSQPLDFSRHELDGPELSLSETFYPLGFPAIITTNSHEVLVKAREMWSMFEKGFNTDPVCVEVRVVDEDPDQHPAAPSWRLMYPLMISVANTNNYCIVNLERRTVHLALSRVTGTDADYLEAFIGTGPLTVVCSHYATPIHGATVALNGRGVLLCGDSGAGKSSLAYACARAGWTYVSDDASLLVHDAPDRQVTGNCHRFRFRPSVVDLFPDVEGLTTTPYTVNKPTREFSTAAAPSMNCSLTAHVDFIVFLNRRDAGPPRLVPYRKEVARHYMRQQLWGSDMSRAVQYDAIERLLAADVLELRYQDLDWAVDRLDQLAREAR